MENKPNKNTDVELWRESEDHYSPSIHVTEKGDIGINVGGDVMVADVRQWHEAMMQQNRDVNIVMENLDLVDDPDIVFLKFLSAFDEICVFSSKKDRRRFLMELLQKLKLHMENKI